MKDVEMTFEEHLAEMRNRLLVCIFSFAALFVLFYTKADEIISWLVALSKSMKYELIYISPQEVLIQELRIVAVISIICTIPIIIYEVVRFVSPAFEQTSTVFSIVCILIFVTFCCGSFFSYKILVPFIYETLYEIGSSTGIRAQVTLSNFVSLFLTFIFCIGMVFEMPLISVGLSKTRLLTFKMMQKGWKPAIVVIFVIAAFITPPDIVSQCLVGLPMVCLYFVSMILVKLFGVKNET